MSVNGPKIIRAVVLIAVIGAAGVLALVPETRERALSWITGNGDEAADIVLYGNVDIRELELAFRQAGRIDSMAFDEGDTVSAGTVMAELDGSTYRDALAAAEAAVRQSQAELDKLVAGNRPEEIAQAEALVRQTEATLRNAERDYERKLQLFGSKTVSEGAVDAAQAARDEARALLSARRETLALLNDGARKEDIAAAAAALAAADARLAQAKTALSDTKLSTPSDAVVLSRIREPGSMVAAGSAVYSLSLRDPVYIRAYAGEVELGRLAPGTAVEIRTDSSDRVYEGQIGFVSPRAEFTPKSVETTDLRTDLVYRLRIVVQGDDTGLYQGMPVTIRVPGPVSGN